MKIEDVKSWIETQKKEIPETAKVELARTEGFFSGALKTITVLEQTILQTELQEEQEKAIREQSKEQSKEKKETK